VVNVNPLYTPRELEHQLKDSGAKAILILENFAVTLQQVISRTDVKHVCVATMGDLLGLKGHLVNFVVRKVKKMVPDWSLPGHVSFKAALAAGQGKTLKPGNSSQDDVAFLQYTGGTTGVSKGATLTQCQRAVKRLAERSVAAGCLHQEAETRGAGLCLRAAALSHLRADGECADGHVAGRAQYPDPQPARHPRLRQGTWQVRVPRLSGSQHPVQCAAEQ
jgi:acyl-CoA synthetase (AMP-forming)/AMP-acid ligase II